MSREILIDPVTRLEGHGRIHIFLGDDGGVDRAYLQVPELRGFEKFAQGRPAEDMPQITSRICGVCPTAHHMASTKALSAIASVAGCNDEGTVVEVMNALPDPLGTFYRYSLPSSLLARHTE